MDPLSITASVAALLGACVKVASTLKTFRDASLHVDTKVKGLITEVDLFMQTLHSMRDTLNDSNVRHSSQLTGHIGDHWNSINECIKDGLNTVQSLHLVLQGLDKSARLFGTVRKQLRFREATEEIVIYQQQIRSYRDTIQLSLQTAIFWNSVAAQHASSETLPKLDELSMLIRTLGIDLNRKLAIFEGMAESPARDAQIRSIQSLRSCVRTSADVVSSASTTLGVSETRSVLASSDYMDIFPEQRQSLMLRWLAETGNITQSTSYSQTPGSVYGQAGILEDSDSEAELEVEMIQLQLQKGKELMKNGNTVTAGKFLAAGISKLKHHRSRYLNADRKLSMLDDLLQPLEEQEIWTEAKRIRLEKMSVLSSDMTTHSDRYLEETLGLVRLLLRARDTNEGRIYARKCIKAYRKLGTGGLKGLKEALALMITACQLDEDEPEEEAYKTMLGHLDMTPDSDSNAAKFSPPVTHADPEASNTPVSNHLALSWEESNSFVSNFSGLMSQEVMEDRSNLNPPNSTAHLLQTIDAIRSEATQTAPMLIVVSDHEFTSASTDNVIEGDSNSSGTTHEIASDYQTIHRSLEATTPPQWTDTRDHKTVVRFNRADTYVDSQDGLSRLINPVYNHQPDFLTNTSGPRNGVSEDSTPAIEIEESISSKGNKNREMKTRSSNEVGAVTTAMTDVKNNTHNELSRSPMIHIRRPSLWELENESNRKEINTISYPEQNTTLATRKEAREVVRFGSVVHREPWLGSVLHSKPSITLPTWVSAMHTASICEPLESSTRLSLNALDRNSSVKIGPSFIDMELKSGGETVHIENQFSADNQKDGVTKIDEIEPNARVTAVIVGPSCSGKSSLIHEFTSGSSEEPEVNNGLMAYSSAMTEPTTMQPIDMVIWDTSGEVEDLIKLKDVHNVNCVVLCMTVDTPVDDIEDVWTLEIRKIYPGLPLILAALRVDLRNDCKMDGMLSTRLDQLSSWAEGKRIMDRIGAVNYFDCSVKKTLEGVQDLFNEVAVKGLQAKTNLQAKSDFRRSGGIWDLTKRSFRRSKQI